MLGRLKPFRAFFKPFEQRVNKRNPLVKLRVLLSVNIRLCLAVASQRTCEEKPGHVYLPSKAILRGSCNFLLLFINKTLRKFACIHSNAIRQAGNAAHFRNLYASHLALDTCGFTSAPGEYTCTEVQVEVYNFINLYQSRLVTNEFYLNIRV